MEEIQKKYKHIEVEKQGEVVIVRLFKDETRSSHLFVRIVFVENKLFYSGDVGTFVFGKTICNIFNFFKGERLNLGYWSEKCEASSDPIVPTDIDSAKVENEVKEFLCEYFGVDSFGELDSDITSEVEDLFGFGIEPNEIRAYDSIKKLFSNIGISNCSEKASDIIIYSKDFSVRYVHACKVIQFVANNLEKWLEEKK